MMHVPQVVEKEAETERRRAVIEAEKQAAVGAIRSTALIAEKESEKLISAIQGMCLCHTVVLLTRRRRHASGAREGHRRRRVLPRHQAGRGEPAQADQGGMHGCCCRLQCMQEYLELVKLQSIANNTKLYFGPSIPTLFSGFTEIAHGTAAP